MAFFIKKKTIFAEFSNALLEIQLDLGQSQLCVINIGEEDEAKC